MKFSQLKINKKAQRKPHRYMYGPVHTCRSFYMLCETSPYSGEYPICLMKSNQITVDHLLSIVVSLLRQFAAIASLLHETAPHESTHVIASTVFLTMVLYGKDANRYLLVSYPLLAIV